jgi:hypothetical protein
MVMGWQLPLIDGVLADVLPAIAGQSACSATEIKPFANRLSLPDQASRAWRGRRAPCAPDIETHALHEPVVQKPPAAMRRLVWTSCCGTS